MARELVLPPDFSDYAWEVESKGVFWDARVRVDDLFVPVTFYDPARLMQDVADEHANGRSFLAARLLVIERLTVDEMKAAVDHAPREFFE